MPDLKDMTDSELIALYNSLEPEAASDLERAVLDEIERRNLDL